VLPRSRRRATWPATYASRKSKSGWCLGQGGPLARAVEMACPGAARDGSRIPDISAQRTLVRHRGSAPPTHETQR
jgi:hypothetical protein